METDLKKVFTEAARKRKRLSGRSEIKKVISEEYDDLSKRADSLLLQESALIRGTLRARRLAFLLFNEEGKLDADKIDEAIEALEASSYFLGRNRDEDSLRQRHMLDALQALKNTPSLRNLIDRLSRPERNLILERVLRETLDYGEHHLVTDRDTRVAVLSAWLTYLRQSVGSCFATAPAILIQSEQPEAMLADFKELIDTGRIKRVVHGEEIYAPMSASWGVGDFRKPIVFESGNYEKFKKAGLSPGLLAALEATGLIDTSLPLKERVDRVIELVVGVIKRLDMGQLFFMLTPERILKEIFLEHFGISETAYREWLERPKDMVYGNLMMMMSHADRGQRGVGQKGAKVMHAMEMARSAFMRLAENALLKTWEFTLASLSESKGEFSTWNLFTSLGLDSKEEEGIGQALYRANEELLERANRKVESYQEEYEMLYSQLKFVEGRAKRASTEKEMKWLSAEYQSRYNEFQTFEAMRNKEHYRAKRLAGLYSQVVERYISLFPHYFQEVYDAEVHDVPAGIWDDRPAGFRLLFKHGRANSAQWTRIDSPDSFSQALASFFSLTEAELSYAEEFEGLSSDVSMLVTSAIQQVKTKKFLESALWRMARKHNAPLIKDPLDHLDRLEKLPWAYTSGGSLNTLVSAYFRLEEKPLEVDRYVDNEIELVVFLADTLKQIPYKVTDSYRDHPFKKILMHSPTHAFNLMPGQKPFQETWAINGYTYTSIRDRFVYPAQHFWERIVVDPPMYEKLMEGLSALVPPHFSPPFKRAFLHYPGEMSPPDLADYISNVMETEAPLTPLTRGVLGREELSSFFFKMLPFISVDEVRKKWKESFHDLLKAPPELYGRYISPRELIELILASYIEETGNTSTDKDLLFEISERMRGLGWLHPHPLIFADTNWPGFFFAMLVSPASGKLELWRVDRLGLNGAPMIVWKEWLNGSHKKPTWGVLMDPYQYTI